MYRNNFDKILKQDIVFVGSNDKQWTNNLKGDVYFTFQEEQGRRQRENLLFSQNKHENDDDANNDDNDDFDNDDE